MKTLTFFNGKGGSGKTTFCMMMASWLHYHKRARVLVCDFDYPEFKMVEQRQRDLELLSDPGSQLSRQLSVVKSSPDLWYEILKFKYTAMTDREIDEFATFLKSMQGVLDYVLFDFGAGFRENGPALGLMRRGLIGLTVVPVYSDQSVVESAMYTCMISRSFGQKCFVFWNRVVRSEKVTSDGGLDRLRPLDELFTSRDISVAKTRIGEMAIFRREGKNWHFIKSTVCWPERNVSLMCPGIVDLFTEVKSMVD